MAKKVVVQLIDDFDGSEATETVSFALDGTNYEIDLSDENAAKLRGDFAQWVKAGHRVSASSRRGPARGVSRPSGPSESSKIREWARDRGIEVSARGRIPEDVRNQYLSEN